MGSLDRIFAPQTAKALLSWRILLGVGVGVATAVAGLPIGVAAIAAAGVYAVSVGTATAKRPDRTAIDPFTVGEPWRHLVQDVLAADRRMRDTVDGMSDGPLRSTLRDIAEQLHRGVEEAWEIARRGNEIDDVIRRLDPSKLRSDLASAEQRAADRQTDAPSGAPFEDPSDDAPGDAMAAVESLRRQLETAERLRQRSEQTAASLRLTRTQLDELVARASEVRLDSVDTDRYRREVDDLVVRLEALHRAIQEIDRA